MSLRTSDTSTLYASFQRGQDGCIEVILQPRVLLMDIPGDGMGEFVPFKPAAAERELGFVACAVPDEFFEPLADDELDAWEGEE